MWSSKIRPILAMSPQTNQVLQDVAVKSYDNPEDIGNKALWPLRVSIVDVCFAVRTFVPKFLLYQMGKKQELPVPLWEKTLVLLKFWKIFSPIFCIIEIISVILFIWEKNHCQMVNTHLYL